MAKKNNTFKFGFHLPVTIGVCTTEYTADTAGKATNH